MEIGNLLIICVAFGGLGFIAFVGIFAAMFHRKLGTSRKIERQEDDEFSETQHLAPSVLNENEIEYTTSNIQPTRHDNKGTGYPHEEELKHDKTSRHSSQGEYSDSSEEVESEPATPDVTPTLTILLRYDRQRNYLLLKLLNMFDLPSRRDKTEVNSFLEIRLLPHFGQNPIQTDVYVNSNHPKLDETFEFDVDSDELSLQKLEFVVMDAREYSNRSIGCALLSVDSLNMNELMLEKEINTVLTIGKPVVKRSLSLTSLSSDVDSGEEMTYAMSLEGLNIDETSLQPRTTKATVRLTKDWEYVAGMEPMILLSLYYEKQATTLFLAIIKVSNLKILPNNKKPDTQVKVKIFIRNKLKMKKKTAILKQELNPVYNQKLDFPVAEKELDNVKIELTIKNNVPGTRGKPHSIYKIVLGNSSSGSCLEHWNAAIASIKPVIKWHALN